MNQQHTTTTPASRIKLVKICATLLLEIRNQKNLQNVKKKFVTVFTAGLFRVLLGYFPAVGGIVTSSHVFLAMFA
jgi:hypothetical protein